MSDDDYYVPYLRRRNSPAQLKALNELFDATPHPTRAQRQALANEIGMELKSVTNWFQNRRQTSRRKSGNENTIHNNNHPARLQPRSKTTLDRSKISLDHIAALLERPSETLQPRLPLTPRKNNAHRKHPGPSSAELWTHMLSSPVLPPSDLDPEEARLAALSSRATIRYPMEWACLKARQKKWVEEDVDQDGLRRGCVQGEALLARTPQFDDVEAAITLLGFKTRS